GALALQDGLGPRRPQRDWPYRPQADVHLTTDAVVGLHHHTRRYQSNIDHRPRAPGISPATLACWWWQAHRRDNFRWSQRGPTWPLKKCLQWHLTLAIRTSNRHNGAIR